MTRSGVMVAAVDLGASSGRVVLGRSTDDGFELHEVHRFPNEAVRAGGRLYWDVLSLFLGVGEGLRRAEREAGGPLDSIGVDSWAVDYGLLDADGALLGNPLCYREPHTEVTVEKILAELGADVLYDHTGIQLQPFNTLFQLLARQGSAQGAAAAHALLVPDLITHWLGGEQVTELTNASTTALLDPRTMQWSQSLATRLGAPVDLFAPLRAPGEIVGELRTDLVTELGLASAPAIATVPSHDTAAAVAGIPAAVADFGYVCTGTWALVGLELDHPVITEESRLANFTNEVGVDGSIRFLRNVTGFWLLQECLREWRARGLDVDAPSLTDAAARTEGLRRLIDVQDPAFSAPGNMPDRIADACLRTSGATLTSPAETARCIFDSIALAVRRAIGDAMRLADRPVSVVHIVGGGVSNALFCQLVADACQLPVIAGPVEAASWGNAMFQARALGRADTSMADIRGLIRRAVHPVTYRVASSHEPWQRAERVLQDHG
ncbi:MAG: rhamnulokinase [Actinomycetota bacterium]|nr:rhamnulokinase [Actinomycetota bacterium]